MKPTIGRIVHYTATTLQGEQTFAGIITAVRENGIAVDLVTFGPGSIHHHLDVPLAPLTSSATPGHWSWPPKV